MIHINGKDVPWKVQLACPDDDDVVYNDAGDDDDYDDNDDDDDNDYDDDVQHLIFIGSNLVKQTLCDSNTFDANTSSKSYSYHMKSFPSVIHIQNWTNFTDLFHSGYILETTST